MFPYDFKVSCLVWISKYCLSLCTLFSFIIHSLSFLSYILVWHSFKILHLERLKLVFVLWHVHCISISTNVLYYIGRLPRINTQSEINLIFYLHIQTLTLPLQHQTNGLKFFEIEIRKFSSMRLANERV